MEATWRKKTRGQKAFSIVNYSFLVIVTMIFVVPLWTTLVISFIGEGERALRGSFIMFPWKIDLISYRYILTSGSPIYASYLITVFRIVVGTTSSLIVSSMMAYALALKVLPFRRTITMMVFIAMLFSGGLVPTFIWLSNLGFRNNLLVYILPQLVNPFWMLLLRNFFMQIPDEIEESATMDGAKPLTILIRIIVPISKPAMVTIGLFYAVHQWVSWFDALVYMDKLNLMPVQNYLRNVLFAATIDPSVTGIDDVTSRKPPSQGIRAAVVIVTTVPVTLIYPWIQKYFVGGITMGSIKG